MLFISSENLFSLLKYLKIFPDFLGHVRNNSNTILIHILSNKSRSKGNLTMKFGELIEYNVRNFFLQKLCNRLVLDLFFVFVFLYMR